jgi:hypothetical protein
VIAYRSRRVLEVAAACLQTNSQERLKPVLEAFGIDGRNGSQQQLDFGVGPKDDNEDDGNAEETGEDNDTHDD